MASDKGTNENTNVNFETSFEKKRKIASVEFSQNFFGEFANATHSTAFKFTYRKFDSLD